VLKYIQRCCDIQHMKTVLQQSVMENAIRQIYVKLPTELLFTEFNTTITLVLLMNYMDLLSAGVGHSCEYRMSRRIVNVGVNMSMIRLLYNEHLYTAHSTDRESHQPALLYLHVLQLLLLLWVWTTAQTGVNSTKTFSLWEVQYNKYRRWLGIEAHRAFSIKFMDFWDVMPLSLLDAALDHQGL
jgi:hypothetical protein